MITKSAVICAKNAVQRGEASPSRTMGLATPASTASAHIHVNRTKSGLLYNELLITNINC